MPYPVGGVQTGNVGGHPRLGLNRPAFDAHLLIV